MEGKLRHLDTASEAKLLILECYGLGVICSCPQFTCASARPPNLEPCGIPFSLEQGSKVLASSCHLGYLD